MPTDDPELVLRCSTLRAVLDTASYAVFVVAVPLGLGMTHARYVRLTQPQPR